MKALVKAKTEPGLWMQEEPVPAPGPDDVLIKIRKTGICGTDIHIYNWDDWAAATIPVPLIIGHEYVGEIVGLGDHVKRLEEGLRVTGEGHLVGQKSRAARAGHFHLDPETRGVGVNRPGAFAEYMTLPAFNVIPLPDEISDDLAAIMDPLGNAVHAALSFDLIGEDVLITGAGPIGIMAGAVARHIGARHIVITDPRLPHQRQSNPSAPLPCRKGVLSTTICCSWPPPAQSPIARWNRTWHARYCKG